jgi:transposase
MAARKFCLCQQERRPVQGENPRFGEISSVCAFKSPLSADSTVVRAHQHAAGARSALSAELVTGAPPNDKNLPVRPGREALGRSRGGLSTKIHLATDRRCRPVARILTSGQYCDCPQFIPLMQAIRIARRGKGRPRTRPARAMADKAYSSAADRAWLRRRGIQAVIPVKEDQKNTAGHAARPAAAHPAFDPGRYKERNIVERCFGKLEGACPCGRDLGDAADLGVVQSFQQEEIPAAPAERVQHDLHKAKCACGRTHVAPRPAGVPGSALSTGPRLRALAVYLVVFQHVPVERCRQLIANVTGAFVSDGFVHSCLVRAASLAADVDALIRALITAARVAGFGETTLRSGQEIRSAEYEQLISGSVGTLTAYRLTIRRGYPPGGQCCGPASFGFQCERGGRSINHCRYG